MAWTERYVDASASGGGTGTSAADPWTIFEAASNSSAGMRINIKAGTYSLTTGFNFSTSGSAAQPIWLRGYKDSIGDLDLKSIGSLVDGVDLPLISSSANMIFDGDRVHLSSISMNRSGNAPTVYHRGFYNWWKNVRLKQSSYTTNLLVNNNNRGYHTYVGCDFQCAANRTGNFWSEINQYYVNFYNCIFQSTVTNTVGATWGAVNCGRGFTFNDCIFKNLPVGIYGVTYNPHVVNCTFVDIADDAIRVGNSSFAGAVLNSYFSNVGGYAIGNTTGTQGLYYIDNNVYQNCGGELENINENLQFASANDTSDEFTDSAAGDYSLKETSSGYAKGKTEATGGYWGIGSTDYSDIGAIQHQDPTPQGTKFHPLS